ncbi:MAG: hypothetical protein ACYT04_74275, partial [Nostoc sp.]
AESNIVVCINPGKKDSSQHYSELSEFSQGIENTHCSSKIIVNCSIIHNNESIKHKNISNIKD